MALPLPLAALAGFFLFIGILSLIGSLMLYRRKRLIENMPTSKVRSIAMGPVEASGKVLTSSDVLTAPLTGRKCVYYSFSVEEQRTRHTKNGTETYWVVIKSGSEFVPFFLKDDTGQVLVDLKGATVETKEKWVSGTMFGGKLPLSAVKFFEGSGINYKGLFGNKTLRLTEVVIQPNEDIFVLGEATDNPFINEGSTIPGRPDIMLAKGGMGSNFYVSNMSEKEILKKSGKWTIIGLAIGSLMVVGSLFVLLLTFE